MKNPHFNEGIVVWRDEYSGRYQPPSTTYSEQFELEWKLSLEDKSYYDAAGASIDDEDIEEILGDEISRLTDQIFRNRLTPEPEVIKLEETLNNLERRKAEVEEFESKKLQFLGQEAIFETKLNHTIETGRFVSDRELFELVNTFINEVDPDSKLKDNDENGISYCLTVRHKLEERIRAFIFSQRGGNRFGLAFIKKVNTTTREIPLTFSHEVALDLKLIEFITSTDELQCQGAIVT